MAVEPAAAVVASTLIGTEAKGQTSRQFGISNATSPKFGLCDGFVGQKTASDLLSRLTATKTV